MSLGKRVKEYRVNNNIDQKEFAKKLEVTQPYLSHLESGKVEASERLKNRILKIIENGTQETLETSEIDNVKSPKHYMLGDLGIEVKDVIFEVVKDMKGSEAVCVGNVLKYVMRARKKNGKEDYKKAAKYLEWVIERDDADKYEIIKYSNPNVLFKDLGVKWSQIISGIAKDLNIKNAFEIDSIFRNIFSENYEMVARNLYIL